MIVKRTDGNQKEIVKELRKRGVYCLDLSGSGRGVPDLMTYFRGQVVYIELKHGPKAALKKTQVKFLSEYPGRCGIVSTADDAYRLATEPEVYCLTQRQKDRLAAFYVRMEGNAVHLPTIEKLLK